MSMPKDKMRIPPATDNRGHSMSVTVRMHPKMVEYVDLLIKRSNNLYKNRSDFFRCACDCFLESSARDTANTSDLFIAARFRSVKQLQLEDEFVRDSHEIWLRLEKTVKFYLENDAPHHAGFAALRIYNSVKMDSYHAEKLRERVLTKYGEVIYGLPAARLCCVDN